IIGNMYRPGDGIKPHVDLARFEDGIGIISLGSSCVMQFRPATAQDRLASGFTSTESTIPPSNSTTNVAESSDLVNVFLEPGDVLAMSKAARYHWTHAIPETEMDVFDQVAYPRGLRISLTLRRV
ncbi:hypothetical protein BJ085DRAFT_4350, partial [Dimargaris cristalligena]